NHPDGRPVASDLVQRSDEAGDGGHGGGGGGPGPPPRRPQRSPPRGVFPRPPPPPPSPPRPRVGVGAPPPRRTRPPPPPRPAASPTRWGRWGSGHPAPACPPVSSSAVASKITSRSSGSPLRLSAIIAISSTAPMPLQSSAPRP